MEEKKKFGLAGNLAASFIDSKITMLIIIGIIFLGMFALFYTPREENPQISVPAANVIVGFPGATPEEVEKLVLRPLEAKMWEIPGVEHVYSMADNSMAVVTVQFYVGLNQEESLFKLYNKLMSNMDLVPSGVTEPLVKPIDIDDVPLITIALSSDKKSDLELRKIGDNVIDSLRSVYGTSLSYVKGGRKRLINVKIDPIKLGSYHLSLLAIAQKLKTANIELPAGDYEFGNRRFMLKSGGFLSSAEDVRNIVVSAYNGKPVFLKNIAEVEDSMEELDYMTRIYDAKLDSKSEVNMVTVAVAKRKGVNAVNISNKVQKRIEEIKGTIIPDDVGVVFTRNDGKRADDTVNELVGHLIVAIISVLGIILFSMSWREALVVSLAIPLTLFITLAIGYLAGQTINRITLFALIMSLGILVDDAIIVVENIYRHYQLRTGGGDRKFAAIVAVDEIGSPTIVATFLIVLVFIPMAFVTGMMGPYMAPIPFNVPVTMFVSMLVAFVVTPWASYKILGKVPPKKNDDDEEKGLKDTLTYRIYSKLMGPMVTSSTRRRIFLGSSLILLLVALSLPVFQIVKFRLLPKANKETFKITIDMPDGTVLEKTDAVVRTIGLELQSMKELKNYQTFTGISDIVDFNGLLRGGSMKQSNHIGEIRVNVIPKGKRDLTSGQIVIKLRPALNKIAEKFGAKIKVVEDPPGPPTRSTMLTEIYGSDYEKLRFLAKKVRGDYSKIDGIVDIDDSVTDDVKEIFFEVDQEKATISGITTEQITHTLAIAFPGSVISIIHDIDAKEQVGVFLRLEEGYRNSVEDLAKLNIINSQGMKLPLSVLVKEKYRIQRKPIYHKDMERVAYVYGEMSERGPVYAVFDLMENFNKDPLPTGYRENHDGEWQMTVDVFRDLGLAMMVGVLIIFLILVGWFKSFTIPMILMGSIPLTAIGIMPGHAALGIFFSSTGMIGCIALAGIVVRNSIILIDFIMEGMKNGRGLYEVVVEAGAVRFRPIFLTAITNVLGVLSIALDPMWESLAYSIIFGVIASTTLTLLVIPALYVEFVGEKNPEEIF